VVHQLKGEQSYHIFYHPACGYICLYPGSNRIPAFVCSCRVVHQLKGERSYHIFYQLVRGASKGQRQELRLPDHPSGFRFLAGSGCTVSDQRLGV
jgi:myosin heavy subunit